MYNSEEYEHYETEFRRLGAILQIYGRKLKREGIGCVHYHKVLIKDLVELAYIKNILMMRDDYIKTEAEKKADLAAGIDEVVVDDEPAGHDDEDSDDVAPQSDLMANLLGQGFSGLGGFNDEDDSELGDDDENLDDDDDGDDDEEGEEFVYKEETFSYAEQVLAA